MLLLELFAFVPGKVGAARVKLERNTNFFCICLKYYSFSIEANILCPRLNRIEANKVVKNPSIWNPDTN